MRPQLENATSVFAAKSGAWFFRHEAFDKALADGRDPGNWKRNAPAASYCFPVFLDTVDLKWYIPHHHGVKQHAKGPPVNSLAI
mmetsp:Transcript_11282/g.19907  ORF Transcript_11282/g.19907 Transcript_11282/m.19907 type:complete len:84 (-) Transcript_11282:73-324(-)